MKKFFFIAVCLILLVSGVFYFKNLQGKNPGLQNIARGVENAAKPLVVILSPHFDDGVLSLGGIMAKRKNEFLVATFFTGRPTEIVHTEWDKISGFSDSDEAMFARTKENENALKPFNTIIKNYDYPDFQYRKDGINRREDPEIRDKIGKDIETLIKTYPDRELFIYGPATFGKKITHPDHQIVHDAFMDVWKKNIQPHAHFLIYEDFPYVLRFANSGLGSLNAYLEKTESMKLKENRIRLNQSELLEKIASIDMYKSQIKALSASLKDNDINSLIANFYNKRCKILILFSYACEVAYSSL